MKLDEETLGIIERALLAGIDAALGEVRRQGGPDYLLTEAESSGVAVAHAMLLSLKEKEDLEIREEDIEVVENPRVEFVPSKRETGPRRLRFGSSGVYHVPTGLLVVCDQEASGLRNKAVGLTALRAALGLGSSLASHSLFMRLLIAARRLVNVTEPGTASARYHELIEALKPFAWMRTEEKGSRT